jgi:hypothetical protein
MPSFQLTVAVCTIAAANLQYNQPSNNRPEPLVFRCLSSSRPARIFEIVHTIVHNEVILAQKGFQILVLLRSCSEPSLCRMFEPIQFRRVCKTVAGAELNTASQIPKLKAGGK